MKLKLWFLGLALAAVSCSKPVTEALVIDVRALASAPEEEALSWEDIASVDGFFEIDPGHTRMWGGVQFLDDYAGGNLLVEDRTTDSVLSLDGDGNIVPLAFPMYAGPGAFTALIAMTAEYAAANLVIAVLICVIILFFVLIGTHWLMRYLGKNSLYIIRKFFGIIVLAIACQLMFSNLAIIF